MSIIHGKGMTGFLSKTNMPYGWMDLVLEAPGHKSHTWRERPKAAFWFSSPFSNIASLTYCKWT